MLRITLPAIQAIKPSRSIIRSLAHSRLLNNSFQVSNGYIIPTFSNIGPIASLTEPIILRIKYGSIPLHIKQLNASNFGFEARTVASLTHLMVESLDPDMQFPCTLENLFVENYTGGEIPTVRNIYFNVRNCKSIEKSTIGEHYLFSHGDGEIDWNLLQCKRYEIAESQRVIQAFGSEITIVKRIPKNDPKSNLQADQSQLDQKLPHLLSKVKSTCVTRHNPEMESVGDDRDCDYDCGFLQSLERMHQGLVIPESKE